jgi:hypothetical protein
MKRTILSFGLMTLFLGQCATGAPQPEDNERIKKFKHTFDQVGGWDYNPAEPFNREELVRLAAHPQENPRRLMWLINRAGAEKDERFRYLLDQKELRKNPSLDLSLAGYDYSVNGNQKALDAILGKLAKKEVGSDAAPVGVLSFIDEWDRTIPAIRAHFVLADGAAGISLGLFWLTREYLFPRSYKKFQQKAGKNVLVQGSQAITP